MTNERAIELLHRISDSQFDGIHGDERREALSMAVRALEPNLSNNGSICTKTGVNDEDRTTGDTIYRQAAIDLMCDACSDWCDEGVCKKVSAIQKLPPAQPTQTNADSTHENTLDCVSRQQAIDGIKKEILKGDRRFYKGLLVANHVIVQLPPAQAERKKGKWIKISPANIYECSECGKNVMTDDISAYDFCHGCGARMEGESDE